MDKVASKGANLSPRLSLTLLLISEKCPCCVRELSRLLELSPAATSKILNRLHARGYINLTPDAIDRRIERVTLTEAGQRTCSEIVHAYDSYHDAWMTVLDDIKQSIPGRPPHKQTHT